jgi:hypothetical protein
MRGVQRDEQIGPEELDREQSGREFSLAFNAWHMTLS